MQTASSTRRWSDVAESDDALEAAVGVVAPALQMRERVPEAIGG